MISFSRTTEPVGYCIFRTSNDQPTLLPSPPFHTEAVAVAIGSHLFPSRGPCLRKTSSRYALRCTATTNQYRELGGGPRMGMVQELNGMLRDLSGEWVFYGFVPSVGCKRKKMEMMEMCRMEVVIKALVCWFY
ncbi:hypothetical protein DEO72_LG7g1856 [Vigna unguiculata]|uniref:Uncharacterized protein n=1 Tax=Vigna unguiculata TaxID=3917 RepID=A0A4D6MGP3_VIGUN|nr:hypothetical protein DEO72_LG7g1856 [Vigna unguiculata]